ncbi:hypothetical protein HUB98_22050 [Paenibacillus barcinonensis]|uniref:Uncharacterized protein n=1 Tax=Paenibacillus barcinonensis TaxID=198119 RepID=A0ABX6Q8X4_PAEBA|nr:hypothetical protein [Paenibacillus barcinonensis]QKS58644.1 hypothetical protein HUB98_22050 [Paenibacillus barcinonensis]
MRIILPIFVSILSIGGGGLFAYFLLILILSVDGGGFRIFIGPPKSQTLLILALILLPFVIAVYILNKKKQNAIKKTIIASFVASFVMSFILIPYQSAILDFFKTPSKHVQSEIRSQVQQVIDRNQLPFVIDQKESESWTDDEVVRTVVYLRKIQEGDIEKNEVRAFIGTAFETDVKLVFNDQLVVNYVTVIIDKGKEVDCTNESYCK